MPLRDLHLQLDERFTHLVSVRDTVLLVGDEDSLLLDHPLVADVVRLLDGRHTAIEIAEALRDRHPPEVVHFLILKLEKAGVVEGMAPAAGTPSAPEDHASGSSSRSALAVRLEAAWRGRDERPGVCVPLDGSGPQTRCLLLTDDYLAPGLRELSGSSEGSDGPFLMARLGARQVWLGPRIELGRTACLACLQERLRINLAARSFLHLPGRSGSEELHVERLPRPTPTAAFDRLSEVLTGWDGGDGKWLLELPLDGSPDARHPVMRLPHCSVCGDPTLAPPGADVRLRSRPREGHSGSGHRTVHPEETLRRLEPLISPLTGVVRHVRKVTVEGAEAAHVYTANHAHCFGAPSLRTLRADRRDHSGGKGMTDLDARVSAVCESVERFSAVCRGTEPVRTARLSELGAEAIHPNELLLFSDAQYRGRGAWNEEDPSGFQWVPEPYGDQPIEWSPVRSLVTGATRLVPSATVYLGFTGEGGKFAKADSNGLASGNCLEEAILQALLELVERDGIALWWYNRVTRPSVDLDSFGDRLIEDTRALYPRLRRDLWALDLTSDLGIPTFVALSSRLDGPPEDIIFGFGAHLDAKIAMLRALSEVNQMLPTILQTPEDRRQQLLPDFEDAIRWWEKATLEAHPYLRPDPTRKAESAADYPRPQFTDLRDDVMDCVSRAAEAGLDVLVHDLTRPDVGFPVARVMVPGLRHFWRRLGPGRLYDAPVRSRWLREALRESDMNSVSMFV